MIKIVAWGFGLTAALLSVLGVLAQEWFFLSPAISSAVACVFFLALDHIIVLLTQIRDGVVPKVVNLADGEVAGAPRTVRTLGEIESDIERLRSANQRN